MSRRHVLAATMLASYPLQVFAQPASSALRPNMPPSIRPATPQDVPAIVALLTHDAQERRSLDPLLWRIAADAGSKAVGAALDGSPRCNTVWRETPSARIASRMGRKPSPASCLNRALMSSVSRMRQGAPGVSLLATNNAVVEKATHCRWRNAERSSSFS
jgi:hypothetical protein